MHSKAWLTLETLTALKSENHVPAQDFCLVQCVEIVQPNHWTIELLLLVVISCCWRRNCAWSLVHLGCNWLNEAPRGALGSRWFKVERCRESLRLECQWAMEWLSQWSQDRHAKISAVKKILRKLSRNVFHWVSSWDDLASVAHLRTGNAADGEKTTKWSGFQEMSLWFHLFQIIPTRCSIKP